jgi:Ca2+-binding EF-hand superfamily protein
MSTRLLALAPLPLVLAGIMLGAHAQTQPSPGTAQPMAAKDRQVVESSFSKADTNADGKVSKDELAKLPAITAKFDDLDKDKDGQLTLDEYSGAFAPAAK